MNRIDSWDDLWDSWFKDSSYWFVSNLGLFIRRLLWGRCPLTLNFSLELQILYFSSFSLHRSFKGHLAFLSTFSPQKHWLSKTASLNSRLHWSRTLSQYLFKYGFSLSRTDFSSTWTLYHPLLSSMHFLSHLGPILFSLKTLDETLRNISTRN